MVTTNTVHLVANQLDRAAFQFGVRTVEGRELHNLVAGKVQLAFTKAADKDVGSVDKKSGKVTFVGQSPTEMVRSTVATNTVVAVPAVLHALLILFYRTQRAQLSAFVLFLISKSITLCLNIIS